MKDGTWKRLKPPSTPHHSSPLRAGQWGTCASCPDHTKLSVWLQLWNCWGLCFNLDVGRPLFTLLQTEMPTDGVSTGRCDQPLTARRSPACLPACGRTHPCCRRLRSLSIRHLSILCSSMLHSSICYMPAQAAHLPVHLMESMRVFNWWLCYVWIMDLLLFCSTPLMPYILSSKTKSACWVFLQRWAHTMFKDSSLWAFN
jgi:hypothetical protein